MSWNLDPQHSFQGFPTTFPAQIPSEFPTEFPPNSPSPRTSEENTSLELDFDPAFDIFSYATSTNSSRPRRERRWERRKHNRKVHRQEESVRIESSHEREIDTLHMTTQAPKDEANYYVEELFEMHDSVEDLSTTYKKRDDFIGLRSIKPSVEPTPLPMRVPKYADVDPSRYVVNTDVLSTDLYSNLQAKHEESKQWSQTEDAIYFITGQNYVRSDMVSLKLTVEAELANGTTVNHESYLFPLQGEKASIWTGDLDGRSHREKDHETYITMQKIENTFYLLIGTVNHHSTGLTPRWMIWDPNMCYFPRPCNLIYEILYTDGERDIDGYNLSAADIDPNGSTLITLPAKTNSKGRQIQISFHVAPTHRRAPLIGLQHIVISSRLLPPARRGFRTRVKEILHRH